jgi:hypothetical protein
MLMMKTVSLLFVSILGFIFCAQCQLSDTLSAKVLWIKNLNRIYLIGIMPDVKSADTIIMVSEVKKRKRRKREELKVGDTYTWAIQQAYQIAYGPTKWSVQYGDVVVWTNKEPFKKQPRLCLNCNGKYISYLYRK